MYSSGEIHAAGSTIILIVALLFLPACDSIEPELIDLSPSEWLTAYASEIDVDPQNTDYSDLSGFGEAIAGHRIVMLGEQSHGDGTTFVTKTRLIKYLHEVQGFDVLAFESGLYDMRKCWSLIEAGESADTGMRRCVFPIWTESAEVQDLMTYVEERARSGNPLELAGFDSQFTGSASADYLMPELQRAVSAMAPDQLSNPLWDNFYLLGEELAQESWYVSNPSEYQSSRFLQMLDSLQTALADPGISHPDLGYWQQQLESLEAHAHFALTYIEEGSGIATTNLRDAQMGRNLIWLAEEVFPDRKIIVWAATFHIARNLPGITTRIDNFSYSGVVNMGEYLAQNFSEPAYVVGFTAYEGRYGILWNDPNELELPYHGSLESHFGQTDFQNAFVSIKTTADLCPWLFEAMLARPLGYAQMEAVWPHHIDGFVFNRTMAPSTPVEGQSIQPRALPWQAVTTIQSFNDSPLKSPVKHGANFLRR